MEEAVQFTQELEKGGDKGVNRAVFSSRQDLVIYIKIENVK
ncbi:hypothetical protein ES703_51086 [subsurface metagenome]